MNDRPKYEDTKAGSIKIAKQLGYSDEIIEKLENEDDVIKRTRILADARKQGPFHYKVKSPFGSRMVNEKRKKENKHEKEEEFQQIIWRRK